MKYAFVKQKDVADCGVACIEMIAKTYGANLKASSIRKVTKTDKDGTTILGILNDPPKMVHRSTLKAVKGTENYDKLVAILNGKGKGHGFFAAKSWYKKNVK